ncbi:MAG: carboxymuconolactone decarboxylase family protein [Parvularculaceae bacterium]
MTEFTIHTAETAPQDSKEMLAASKKAFGFVPNLHAVFAESPQALEAYKALSDLFAASSLSNDERNVVWLAINVEHHCLYCVPAHTWIAQSQGLDEDTVNALRSGSPLSDPKLETLRSFTLKVVRQRGVVTDADVEEFLSAGFTKQNILDVILGVTHKVLSNYTNHFADTPVDEPFAAHAWTPTVS